MPVLSIVVGGRAGSGYTGRKGTVEYRAAATIIENVKFKFFENDINNTTHNDK